MRSPDERIWEKRRSDFIGCAGSELERKLAPMEKN